MLSPFIVVTFSLFRDPEAKIYRVLEMSTFQGPRVSARQDSPNHLHSGFHFWTTPRLQERLKGCNSPFGGNDPPLGLSLPCSPRVEPCHHSFRIKARPWTLRTALRPGVFGGTRTSWRPPLKCEPGGSRTNGCNTPNKNQEHLQSGPSPHEYLGEFILGRPVASYFRV